MDVVLVVVNRDDVRWMQVDLNGGMFCGDGGAMWLSLNPGSRRVSNK
jgi:hypothetical protein